MITREELEASFIHFPTIPYNLREGLVRFVVDRVPNGSFLTYVFANDLLGAVSHADPTSLAAIKSIAQWVHNEAPFDCHGSPAKVAAWLTRPRYEGPIEENMQFCWAPNIEHARCTVRVIGFGQIDGERTIRAEVIEAGRLSDVGDRSWNEESRFREMVVRLGPGAKQ